MRPDKDLPTSIFLDFFYFDENGILRWRKKSSTNSHACPGDITGGVSKDGYYRFSFEGVSYKLHRMLYKIYNNIEVFESIVYIDHVNRDKLNNSNENLRACTQQQNSCNTKTPKNNTTGIKGISKAGNVYRASVQSNGFQIRQQFPYTEAGLQLAQEWLVAKRAEMHGEFANNG